MRISDCSSDVCSSDLLLGAAACVCLAAAAAAEEPMLFDVLRDGSKIGAHRLVFEQEDGALKVSVETDMTVDFAFVQVFCYAHKRVERWRDGVLESLDGLNDEEGTDYEITIVCRQRGLMGKRGTDSGQYVGRLIVNTY